MHGRFKVRELNGSRLEVAGLDSNLSGRITDSTGSNVRHPRGAGHKKDQAIWSFGGHLSERAGSKRICLFQVQHMAG